MRDFKHILLWVYIGLLLAGGLIGFYKAKSKVSLITSAACAALLALLAAPQVFERPFAAGLANILLAALLVLFAYRLGKTGKFMPSGLMLVLTGLMLAVWNVFKG